MVEDRLHLNKTKKTCFYLVLYSICTIFALVMSKRREKNKPQPDLLNKQLAETIEIPREKDELSLEIGKFLLDLAKLTFAGVFLTGIMDMDIDMMYLIITGMAVIALLAFVGFKYIKRGINKK